MSQPQIDIDMIQLRHAVSLSRAPHLVSESLKRNMNEIWRNHDLEEKPSVTARIELHFHWNQ
jgi:hypothetical protein